MNNYLNVQFSEIQKRIVQLTAEGMTNKEIASKLFISVSTVKYNLGCIYEKLKILVLTHRTIIKPE